ncbi:DUF4856 domain-containing protein [Tenacibaculum sp. IB213877]|uniref:DUF4856 domain-containing protein n=1 Tax=Tenacibaculum sp. IB213877 TaxID=3097351 RepID=UPI002A59C36C|nr:DUF4856 domain-containing protein [Tenacibaculum sp. IB213877]MDY0779702.1 DUF4856 domain-containing protein [Tenacibaculum sp. IB213877]
MKKIILSVVAVSATIFTSCSDDNNTPAEITAPATYKFERSGSSTVSFSGQTTRILMAEQLVAAFKDPNKTQEELNAMFAHAEGDADFSNSDLNASSKNIRSKTAASLDYFSSNTTEANAIKTKFDGWIEAQVTEVFPNWEVAAEAGVAGQIQQNGGGSIRYVNAKGLELNQAFAKSLIGGLMADQMLNNYLSVNVLDEGTNVEDNDAVTLVADKNYTTMEHKWDEAYGYLYGAETDAASPVLGADSFLNKYVNSVDSDDDFAGIANDIYEAFKLGRAAIVAKDYQLRDKQAEIIREAVSKVIAVRAVHYLQGGKANLGTDMAAAFHDLSEGYGFIQALRFTRSASTNQPHLPVAEIEAFLGVLMDGNGFWSVSADALDQISIRIATVYGFTVEEAAN